MICQTCQGRGDVLRFPAEVKFGRFLMHSPCPDCNGSGVQHCCDGLTAANDPEDKQEGE